MPRAVVAAAPQLSPDEGRACSRAHHLALTDHSDAGVGNGKAAFEVVGTVDADARARRDHDELVDDGSMDRGVATDLDEVEKDAVGDGGVAVDVNTRGEHRVGHLPTADHDAG